MRKFNLRIKRRSGDDGNDNKRHWRLRKNQAHCSVRQDVINNKQAQIDAALEWCSQNDKRGQAALRTGKFPLIKDCKTINRRLDGEVENGKEREYCSILTVDEERQIVNHVKNKNRALQGCTRKDIEKAVIHTLKTRKFLRRKYPHRNIKPLSRNAKRALESKSVGKSYWKRWDAQHSDLSKKRQGTVNLARAINCTRSMAENHLDELADELSRLGIFTNVYKEDSGEWIGDLDTSRVYNHDETPQFINYGVDGSGSCAIVYGAKGEACNKLIRENRECVTIDPFVSLDGNIEVCHVIFKYQGLEGRMAPKEASEKIENLLISSTDNGVQNGKSLLDAYTFFNECLEKRGVQKPIVLLSDGHSSRFYFDVLSFTYAQNIHLFLGPPDTTGVTQLLNQINHTLHHKYEHEKTEMFITHKKIDREGFMLILAEFWNTWETKESICNAARRVGISKVGLNIEWMQQDKFEKAEAIIDVGSSSST